MSNRSRFLLLVITCLLCFNISFSQNTDTLYLINGQILRGNIKNINLGVIAIDDIDLNTIKVKQNKIKAVKTVHRFKVETTNQKIYYGSLGISKEEGHTTVEVSDTEKVDLKFAEINTMLPLEQKFFNRLDGNMTAGFSFTKSTSIGQINLSSQVKYVTQSFQNQLNLSTIGSIDSNSFSRDNETAELFSEYSLNTKWFLAGLLGYQRNLELSISSRLQEMVGAGNKLIVRKNLQLLAISGLTFNQEKSTTGVYNGMLIEVPLMLRFDLFQFKNPNLQISTTQTTYIGLTQFGRVRFSGNTSISYELIHDFSLSFNIYNNYDNQPPSATTSNIDYGIVIGLTYKF